MAYNKGISIMLLCMRWYYCLEIVMLQWFRKRDWRKGSGIGRQDTDWGSHV